jgi:hypothetical protein
LAAFVARATEKMSHGNKPKAQNEYVLVPANQEGEFTIIISLLNHTNHTNPPETGIHLAHYP